MKGNKIIMCYFFLFIFNFSITSILFYGAITKQQFELFLGGVAWATATIINVLSLFDEIKKYKIKKSCPSCKKLGAGERQSKLEQGELLKCKYCGHEWSIREYGFYG